MQRMPVTRGGSQSGDQRQAMRRRLGSFLSSCSEWLALAAAFLMPLFYLPFTSDPLEMPKQTLLLALVGAALLAWMGSALVERSLSLRRTVAYPAVLILLAVTAVSALASSSRQVSLLGYGGQEYQSLLGVFLFAGLFFVIVNVPDKRPLARRALFAMSTSVGLASLLAILQLSGVKALPYIGTPAFNTAGSSVMLGLSAAVAAVICSALFLLEDSGKLWLLRRIALGLSGMLSLVVMALLDFWPVWTAALLGLLFILAYAVVRPQAIAKLTRLAVPMGAVMVCTLMLFVNLKLPISAPPEYFPTPSQSLKIAGSALVSHPVFGSGPGTYGQGYDAHRGTEANAGPFWSATFNRAFSFLLTLPVTAGLAGLVAWLAVIVIGAWKSVAFLVRSKKADEAWIASLAVGAAWIASAAGLIIYGATFATMAAFWILLALAVRSSSPEFSEIKFMSSPRAALATVFAFVAAVVLTASLYLVGGMRVYADALLVNGVGNDAAHADQAIAGLEKAFAADPRSGIIAKNLAVADIVKMTQVAADEKADTAAKSRQIQALMAQAVSAAKAATDLAPEDAVNWSQLGTVYEAISGFASDAPEQAVSAYRRAAELSPSSPAFPLAIARVYGSIAKSASDERRNATDEAGRKAADAKFNDALDKAETELNKAMSLKSDYAEAGYQLALVKDAQGKTPEAIAQLVKVESSVPGDSGVAFDLATLYYRDGQKDKAEAELLRAIALAPKYDTARWLLAEIYEGRQKWDEAIAQVKAILENEPDNDQVKKRLQTLEDEKAGKAAAADEKKK